MAPGLHSSIRKDVRIQVIKLVSDIESHFRKYCRRGRLPCPELFTIRALSAREAHLFTREKDCDTWIFGVVLFCFVSPLLSNVLQVNSQWGDGDD